MFVSLLSSSLLFFFFPLCTLSLTTATLWLGIRCNLSGFIQGSAASLRPSWHGVIWLLLKKLDLLALKTFNGQRMDAQIWILISDKYNSRSHMMFERFSFISIKQDEGSLKGLHLYFSESWTCTDATK